MAKSPHIRLMVLSAGENSRDSIHELEENQVAEMVNLVPGDVLSPRGGCPVTGAYSREIDWIYPFRDNQGSKLSVAKAGTDLVQITPAGQITILKEGAFPTLSTRPCAQRIQDSLLIGFDKSAANQSFVVTKRAGALQVRQANVRRPGSTSLAVIPEAASGESYAAPARSCRKFATTWVIRDDADGIQFGNPITTTIFGSAIAESWEDADERLIFTGSNSDTSRIQSLEVIASDIPEGATHLRLWASLSTQWASATSPAGADVVAAGAHARFWIDVAVTEAEVVPNGFRFVKRLELTEGMLQGQTYVTDTTGASEIPPCSAMLYHNGFLWVCGGDSSGVPGRAFYSLDISDPPIRTLSLFDLGERFVDTSVDGTERIMGMASSFGHLLFLNEIDVWRLQNGDPETAPRKIAEDMGTTFPNTITQHGQQVWYLSNRGPAVISDDVVRLIEPFDVGMAWPSTRDGVGYFHSLSPERRLRVRSWWKDDTWYISDGNKTCAMKMSKNEISGGYRIEIAAGSGFTPSLISKFSDSLVYAFGNGKVASWCVDGTYSDLGYFPTCTLLSRPGRIDGRRREKVGEVMYVLAHARWTDIGQLGISCISQNGRSEALFQYQQRTIDDPLQNIDINNEWRRLVQQHFPEGVVGSWFQVGIRKIVRGPFEVDGMEIGYLPLPGHEFEYVSYQSTPESIPVLDEGLLPYDQELNRGYNG